MTDTTPLGYTYPEFQGLDTSDPRAVQSAIANTVNQLYGGATGLPWEVSSLSTPAAAVSTRAIPAASAVATKAIPSEDVVSTEAVSRAANVATETAAKVTSSPAPRPSNPHGEYYDWAARIHVKKYELGGSFAVLIFLGDVPEDPEEWRLSPSFVGAHQAFVNTSAAQCENCRNQADQGLVIEGFVPLNKAIARYAPGLGSFDASVVEPVLQKGLHWRVQRVCLCFSLPLPWLRSNTDMYRFLA